MKDEGTSADILLKTYQTEQGLLAAAADEDLVGSTFEEDGVKLDVDEEFYGGEPSTREEVGDVLRQAATANLVGERTVEAGVESGEIDSDIVLEVEGVPHAQMVRL